MIRTLADQYLAQNAGRRYPFREDTKVPEWLTDAAILDFRCTVSGIPAGTAPEASLTGVGRTQDGAVQLTVTLAAMGKGMDTLRFLVPVGVATEAPYTAYAAGEKSYAALTVTAAVIPPPGTEQLPDEVDIPFAATTVVCDSLKVASIQSVQDPTDARDENDAPTTDVNAMLTGEVALAEGRNSEPYLDGQALRVEVFRGGGIGERCQSAGVGSQTCETVLFTINGERPGSDGELRIVGNDGISVTPVPDEHAVEIRMDGAAAAKISVGCAPACQRG